MRVAIALALFTMGSARAAEGVGEEIIVYGDDFARWDRTRWLVQSELVLPMGVIFARDATFGFESYAFQVRTVLNCEKDAKLSRKKWEVSCTIEDIGLLVTSARRYKRERDRELVEDVLAQVDGKLTGLDIQLQVDIKGGVTNVDLEGLKAKNQREREALEGLRQVVLRTVSGFHLRIPDHAQRGGQWVEYNSQLLQMPSDTASRGSTTLVHQVDPVQGNQIVQTVGNGNVQVTIPPKRRTVFSESPLDPDGFEAANGGESKIGGGQAFDPATITERSGEDLDIVASYDMTATGVAVFDRDTGIMTERVWVCQGWPTASSGGGTFSLPFRNAGRLTMLGKKDQPNVGPTKQVAPPGQTLEGLDGWVEIEGLPEE